MCEECIDQYDDIDVVLHNYLNDKKEFECNMGKYDEKER